MQIICYALKPNNPPCNDWITDPQESGAVGGELQEVGSDLMVHGLVCRASN